MVNKKQTKDKQWRPDLTGYEIYAQTLLDRMNDDPGALGRMTVTDVVKILIEQKHEQLVPGVKVTKRRKIFQRIDY